MKTPEHIREKFLPFEHSKKIAGIGFDEECFAYYENQDATLVAFYSNLPLGPEQEKRPGIYESQIRNSTLPQWATATPTVSDAMDWYFDRFKLYAEIYMDDDLTFGFLISRPASVVNFDARSDYPMKRGFESRRKARLSCLDEMFAIVKEKKHLDESPKPLTEMMKKMNLLNSEKPIESFGQKDELNKIISKEVDKKSKEKKT
jgi:hypothetical protein